MSRENVSVYQGLEVVSKVLDAWYQLLSSLASQQT